MTRTLIPLTTLAAVLTLASAAAPREARSQTPPPAASAHQIPQSLRIEHEETIERIASLARRPGAVGAQARKALDLFKRHIAREQEYILPPLTLLPVLADGKVTPDMAWALAMVDRVKADREVIFKEHTDVTDAMNALRAAALKAGDKDAAAFADAASGDSLNDIELIEPTVLLIGEFLRARLPAAH